MNKGQTVKDFEKLAAEARTCRVCPKMEAKTAVLSELNGTLDPRVFFIAEAPGRQGADRTRRPFWGDKSGENFQVLLDSIGLTRDEIFITNTVLCSPRTDSGANRKPTRTEIGNCSGFLERTIGVIRPRIVATLGSVALEALKTIEYHQITLKNGAGAVHEWNSRLLVPLYHPSPQVVASHRRLHEQIVDFRAVAEAIGRFL
jgi:DNA polymerase